MKVEDRKALAAHEASLMLGMTVAAQPAGRGTRKEAVEGVLNAVTIGPRGMWWEVVPHDRYLSPFKTRAAQIVIVSL